MRAYRILLLLYPRPFRERFGAEMTEAFERLLEKTREKRGSVGVTLLWIRTALDAATSGLGARFSGGAPDRGAIRRTLFHFRQAVRSLRRSPAYASTFVLTLGLAIGVNSAVFNMVNGVLLRPLPFQDADRIVYLKQPATNAGMENTLFSFIEIDDYRAAATTIDEFVEFGEWEFTVVGQDEPHRALGGLVTSNYFGVLGMRPAIGRLLNEQDDIRGAEPVALLTNAYWDSRFGRDPSVIGRILELENLSGGYIPTRVVGVLEPGYQYSGSRRPDFYVNYSTNSHYQDAAMRDARTHRMTDVFARMAPGVTLSQARSELTSIADELHRRHPEAYDAAVGFGLDVVSWRDELTRRGRSTFLLLMGAVGIVLVLAGANVGNLTLTRLIRRQEELSTRAALGASTGDLRLHLSAEHVLLGLAGGLVGLVFAFATRVPLVAYASRYTVRADEIGVDWTVFGATVGVAILLASVVAWLPGLPVNPGSRAASSFQSRTTDSRLRKQIQRGLIVTQLALSFALVTGADLLVRSAMKLSAVDPGFIAENVLTLRTPSGPAGTGVPGQADPGWDGALDEIRAFPGVRSAAIASWSPLSAPTPTALSVRLDGEEDDGDRSYLSAANDVSPDYFETLGIPLVAGRYFDENDREGSTEVVILNESMARAHFRDADPIGHRISLSMDGHELRGGGGMAPLWLEIVGVVADSREYGMETEGVHTFYRPAAQATQGPAILVAHRGDPAALTRHVRDVIHRMQPDRAVEQIRTMSELVDQDTAPSRLNAALFGSFAALALVIAAVGLLGVLAFSVSQRVREFGIRMAVGADRSSVLRSVLGEGLLLAALALFVGAAGALLLRRFMTTLLFGVEPGDPTSFALAAATLTAVALLASYLPALRATRIQPTVALKGE